MRSRKAKMRSVFSFLLVCSLLVPIQARAAETVTREKTFQTEENSEEAFAQQSGIADLVEEDGKTYELQDVSYEVLEKKYLGNVKKVTDSEVMAEGTAYEPPKTLREGNLTYTLKKTEKQERSIEGEYTQPVSAFDEYDHPVGAGDVPQTKTVSVLNQKTGQNQDVVCTFSGISTAGTAVRENQITITFQEYDASVYEWNGNLLPRNDEVPPLAGYESQLLESVGAAEGSQVTGLSWVGEPYEAEGVLYRDAVATVQQVVTLYRADYHGQIHEAEQKGVVYRNTYEAPDPQGEIQYTVKATAEYTQMSDPWIAYLLTGAGIAIFIGAVVLILILLSRKKQKD